MSKANKSLAEGNQTQSCSLEKVGKGFLKTYTVKSDLSRLAKTKPQGMEIYKNQVTIRSENMLKEILKNFAIKNRKGLKSLDLNIIIGRYTKNKDTMDRNLDFLWSEIAKKFPGLQRLTFSFADHHGKETFSENGFAALITQVARSFISLKYLTLSFPHFKGITDAGIELLGSELSKNLPNLEKLVLQFEFCSDGITNDGIQALGSKISKSLVNLKCLSLNFHGCSEVNAKGIKTIFSEICPDLPKLKQLSFAFSDYQQSDSCFGLVASELAQHPIQLQSFSLEVWCKPLTDKSIITLASTLATHLSSLRELSLEFSPCANTTDNGVKAIAQQIVNLANLHKLALKFKGDPMTATKISDKGAQALISAITDRLTKLEDLTIDLPFSKITDLSIKTIGHEITRKLVNLRCLSLNLEGCDEITNNAIELIVTEIVDQGAPLKKLGFRLNPTITDTALQALTDKVCEGLVGLSKLDLSFCYCYEITEEGMHYFAAQIKERLINLEDLTLTFDEDTTSSALKRYLKKKLESIPNLMIVE